MNIDDYVDGTAYIIIPRDVFSDKNYYNNLLSFLKLPSDTDKIKIYVNKRYTISQGIGNGHYFNIERNYE